MTRVERVDLRSTAYADAILDSLPGIFYVLDEEGRLIRWNRAFETVLGYSAEEIRGRTAVDFLDECDRGQVTEAIATAFASGHAEVEATARARDGSPVTLLLTGSRMVEDGRRCLVGVGVDLTERRRAEEALATRVRYEQGLSACSRALLAREEGALSRALGNLLDAAQACRVYIFENYEDPVDGLCLRQTCEVCAAGVPPQIDSAELQHVPYSDGIGRWRDSLSAGRPLSGPVDEMPDAERRYLEPQGILSLAVLPIRVAGSWYGLIGFDDTRERRLWREEDIDLLHTAAAIIGSFIERERVEDQLRQARKIEAVGRLAAGVAHDFNNMLTPILGFAEMLAEEMHPSDPRYKMVSGIRNAAEQSRGLIHQLLSYSRRQVLELKPVDLRGIVGGMETLLRRTLRETVSVKVHLAPQPCFVRADVTQIEQAILNLALNAQDAMPEGGVLTIRVEALSPDEGFSAIHPEAALGRYAALTVSDTGCGMGPEAREHVFEPFFTTKGKGTGLGLATVYGSVRQHGGVIAFESLPGHGTTFTIYLPLKEEATSTAQEAAPAARTARGDETILLVEDNDMVRQLVETALRQRGYTVLAAASGTSCLELLGGGAPEPQLLLTDIIMPGMNGRELFARVSSRYPRIRVLYMSGYTNDVIADHGVLEEGVCFIQKPFSMQALAEGVRDALRGV